jgi:hypothetical protein
MALSPTRAQKAMREIGTARGNLAFLAQDEPGRMGSILGRFATQYRIAMSAMTRTKRAAEATSDDCAAALIRSLDRLTVDASYIRGINRVDSSVLNPHLQALAAECAAFALAQPVIRPSDDEIGSAMRRFIDRGLGSGTFAGSALDEVAPSLIP